MTQVFGISPDEFRESIEEDGALDRRFQRVVIEPPSLEEGFMEIWHAE